jgi:hypothetical protein
LTTWRLGGELIAYPGDLGYECSRLDREAA